VSSDQIAALGAFLSGAGAVLGALFTIRALRKRLEKQCQERIRLLKEGIEIGERHMEHEDDHVCS
jgi:hypothetical protein